MCKKTFTFTTVKIKFLTWVYCCKNIFYSFHSRPTFFILKRLLLLVLLGILHFTFHILKLQKKLHLLHLTLALLCIPLCITYSLNNPCHFHCYVNPLFFICNCELSFLLPVCFSKISKSTHNKTYISYMINMQPNNK